MLLCGWTRDLDNENGFRFYVAALSASLNTVTVTNHRGTSLTCGRVIIMSYDSGGSERQNKQKLRVAPVTPAAGRTEAAVMFATSKRKQPSVILAIRTGHIRRDIP